MTNKFIDPNISKQLSAIYNKFKNNGYLKQLFNNSDNRASEYSLHDLGYFVDYSKNWIDRNSLDLLLKVADQSKLDDKIDAMYCGEIINTTEQRAVLHTALRDLNSSGIIIENDDVFSLVRNTQVKIKSICDKLINNKLLGFTGKPITTIVNLGIGGSDLGPKMAYYALKPYWNNSINCHFVSNIDPFDINTVLEQSDPETTLFIVCSKSFTTIETLANANTAKHWMLKYCSFAQLENHFIAVTSSIEKAKEFCIDKENILPMWDWVGGRYSLWSAIGLIIALGTCYKTYSDLLKGANDLDKHFKSKSWSENIPVILALLGIGYINYAGATSHALLPYCQNLEYFPSYIQQLDMESNGKSVDATGNLIDYNTGPIIWGAPGTNGQHAFHQLLHQGTHIVPCDFIIPVNSFYQPQDQQQMLVANALAQSRTLLEGTGSNKNANHKLLLGNKPSTTIMFDKLTPYNLGVLIAIYEHKVFTQGAIWGINSFDQWGVERGKLVAKDILEYLKIYNQSNKTNKVNKIDCSTAGLLDFYQQKLEQSNTYK